MDPLFQEKCYKMSVRLSALAIIKRSFADAENSLECLVIIVEEFALVTADIVEEFALVTADSSTRIIDSYNLSKTHRVFRLGCLA